MSDEKAMEVPKRLIDDLKAFLKFYEYGCHMLDGLVERHLEGADIVPQISALSHIDGVRGIFYFISSSDETAKWTLSSDLIDENGRRKLSDIRSKYHPILEDVLDVAMAIFDRGEINPLSSVRFLQRYEQEDETLYLDMTVASGQREIFRVVQDASELLTFALAIISSSSASLELCQIRGLPLRKEVLKRLERLQKDLQDASARLSKVTQKYLSAEGKGEVATK